MCVVWLARRRHNRQHMPFTRGKVKLVKSGKAALGSFHKKVCEMQCDGTFLREMGGNIIRVIHAILQHVAKEQITKAGNKTARRSAVSLTEIGNPPPVPKNQLLFAM